MAAKSLGRVDFFFLKKKMQYRNIVLKKRGQKLGSKSAARKLDEQGAARKIRWQARTYEKITVASNRRASSDKLRTERCSDDLRAADFVPPSTPAQPQSTLVFSFFFLRTNLLLFTPVLLCPCLCVHQGLCYTALALLLLHCCRGLVALQIV
jgi:hypothetical protein